MSDLKSKLSTNYGIGKKPEQKINVDVIKRVNESNKNEDLNDSNSSMIFSSTNPEYLGKKHNEIKLVPKFDVNRVKRELTKVIDPTNENIPERDIEVVKNEIETTKGLINYKDDIIDSKYSKMSNDLEELNSKYTELENKNYLTETTTGDLINKLEEKTNKVSISQTELEKKQEYMKEEKEGLENKTNELYKKYETIESLSEDLNRKSESLENKTKEMFEKYENLTIKSESFGTEQKTLQDKYDELELIVNKFSRTCEKLEKENTILYMKYENLEKDFEELKVSNNKLLQQMECDSICKKTIPTTYTINVESSHFIFDEITIPDTMRCGDILEVRSLKKNEESYWFVMNVDKIPLALKRIGGNIYLPSEMFEYVREKGLNYYKSTIITLIEIPHGYLVKENDELWNRASKTKNIFINLSNRSDDTLKVLIGDETYTFKGYSVLII